MSKLAAESHAYEDDLININHLQTMKNNTKGTPTIVLGPGISFVHLDNSTGSTIRNIRYVYKAAGSSAKWVSLKLASSLVKGEQRTFELINQRLLPVEARIEYKLGGKNVASETEQVLFPGVYIREHYFNIPKVYDPHTLYMLSLKSTLPQSKVRPFTEFCLGPDLVIGAKSTPARELLMVVSGTGSKAGPAQGTCSVDVLVNADIFDLRLSGIDTNGNSHVLDSKGELNGSPNADFTCLFSFNAAGLKLKQLTLSWSYAGKGFETKLSTKKAYFLWAAFRIVGAIGGEIWDKDAP